MRWNRGSTWYRLVVVMAGAVALAPGSAWAQQATVPRAEHTIRVVGTGEVKRMPDEAQLLFAVETFAESARAAGEQNAQAMERVIAALLGAGVPRESTTTANYSLHAEYVHDEPRGEMRIRGYRATNQVSLRTLELDRVGALIDVALAAGATRVDALSFALRDSRAAEAEALRRAVADARAQAEVMASALGVVLGDVLDATTNSGFYQPMPVGRERFEMAMSVAAPTPVQPGEQTVTAQATVVFGIAR